MYVNSPRLEVPEWVRHCKYGDLPIMLLLSLQGDFQFIPDLMAVYRLHDAGYTTLHKAYDKVIVMIYIYESFNIHTQYRYKEATRNAMLYEMNRHLPIGSAESSNQTQTKRNLIYRNKEKLRALLQYIHQRW
jgi:hypothetical protein